jgi:predicted GTPase
LQGPNSSLNLNVKILVIGLRGTGKTQLIRSLLAMGSSSSSSGDSSSSSSSVASLPLDAFSGATKRVEVSQGQVLGVTLTLIDTPGLTASAAGAAANAAVLRKLRKAFQQHEPDLVLYVDRYGAGSFCVVLGVVWFVRMDCCCALSSTALPWQDLTAQVVPFSHL